jgi:hypothetical protein
MANDPSKQRPDDLSEPDNTIIQPGAIRPGGDAMARHGETIAEGDGANAIDKTVELPSARGAAPKAAVPAAAGKAASSPAGQVFAGRFEVVVKLGEGGMGVVYRARDREIEGREIALKVLRPRFSRNAKFRELFFREIHAAQGFVSEHVVQVRDTGKSADGTLFLTMDLIDGEPLDTILERESVLNERHALEIARQTLLALASGHEQGFVHRDIKPSNVMLAHRIPKTDDNPFGVGVRVLDFGIAGLTAQIEEGLAIGTPRYMSPEQVQGQRLDGRSDLFAVGILLYEMLSGSRPFDGKTLEECRTSILETDVKPLITELENLSDPIRKILAKALQKNRDKRYQSAADFIQAIEKSSAFREKRGVPFWAHGMFFVGTACLGALGWLLWDQNKEYRVLQNQLGGIEGRHAQELVDVGAKHQGVLDGLTKELEQMRSERDSARAEMDTAKLKAEQTTEAKDKEAEERRRREQEVTQLKDQVGVLEKELRAIRQNSRPEVVAVHNFDHITRLIQGRSPQEAKLYMEDRRSKGELSISEGEGASHIQYVVDAAVALDAASKALVKNGDAAESLPSAEVFKKASRDYREGVFRLKQADESVESFRLESTKWLNTPSELDEGQPADRMAVLAQIRTDLKGQIDGIQARIEELNKGLAENVARERAELMKTKFSDDPTALIEHMRAYADDLGPLTEVVDRLAKEAEAACAPGGRIDLARLVGLESIRKWGQFLTDDGARVAGSGAESFRWLWAAHKWYGGDALDPKQFAFVDQMPKVTGTDPQANWRAQLALQHIMAATLANFIADGQGASVYRQRSADAEKTDWYYEVMQADKESKETGRLDRQRVDEGGTFGVTQSIRLAVRNDAIHAADKPVLEVRTVGEHLRVALWKPKIVAPLPDQTWARGMNHQIFQQKIARGLVCLVVETAKTRYWFAPGYGLVRQEIAGVFEREVCYTTRVR